MARPTENEDDDMALREHMRRFLKWAETQYPAGEELALEDCEGLFNDWIAEGKP